MDDQQKSRIIALAVAGVLLIGGGIAWKMYSDSQTEKASADADANVNQNPAAGQTAQSGQNANPAGTQAASQPGTPSDPSAATPATQASAQTPAPAQPPAPAQTATEGQAPGTSPTLIASADGQQQSAGQTPAPATTPAAPGGKYGSTKREEAISAAKQVAGRQDPMAGGFERPQYPSPWSLIASAGGRTTVDDERDEQEKANKERLKNKTAGGSFVPPPPPLKERAVPPPPPASSAGAIAEAPSLPIDNLPMPPDKPLVSPGLRLSAIVGNKAMLAVPLKLRMQNKWPAVICLGPGEKFEDPSNGSFSVVSVDRDSVTMEEEQERSVKSLPPIR